MVQTARHLCNEKTVRAGVVDLRRKILTINLSYEISFVLCKLTSSGLLGGSPKIRFQSCLYRQHPVTSQFQDPIVIPVEICSLWSCTLYEHGAGKRSLEDRNCRRIVSILDYRGQTEECMTEVENKLR